MAMCHRDNSHTIKEWFLAGWVDSRQHITYARWRMVQCSENCMCLLGLERRWEVERARKADRCGWKALLCPLPADQTASPM